MSIFTNRATQPDQKTSSSTQFETKPASRVDHRGQLAVQRRFQEIADGNNSAHQLQVFQNKLNVGTNTLQRLEKEPLQAKRASIQGKQENDTLQGKFESVQRVEEEEPLQGKFDTVQRVEEEEPLQGKFDTVQRVEEEELLQGKFDTVQRVEEEEPLQGKFLALQRKESGAVSASEVSVQNRDGLPAQLRAGIESLSGMNMDHVKVHYNSDRPAQLNAHAYAQGSEIHVAPGQEQHLPHEAWHVVQQAQGRVRPTMQMKQGVPVNDDAGLESEADAMGSQAMSVGQTQLAQRQALKQAGFREVALQRMIRGAYPVAQMNLVMQRRETSIIDSARNHYDDGWGALYDVTEDSELLDRVGGSDSDPDREWRINLGDFYHEEEDVTRNCKIAGEDWTKTVGPKKYKKTKIWHCGPSSW